MPTVPFDKCSVSGSVVLYNSDIQALENIHTYLTQVDHLFIIDNSDIENYQLIQYINLLSNVTYLFNGCNMGIAYALNKAAALAINAGYKFLLTMDDDTSLPEGAIDIMLEYVNRHGTERIGIITGQSVLHLVGDTVKSVSHTITSGNLLNLSAYRDCGPFMNELFIDFVDHEYCFRLTEKKYIIYEINYIYLKHRLGEKKYLKFLKFELPIMWVSHNPLRIYYKTRNCIFVLKKYGFIKLSLKLFFYKDILKDLLKIIFLENNKINRVSFFIKALVDGFNGNLGKKLAD
ncbi:glycosyltransferase [Spirosoma jeollabukense]